MAHVIVHPQGASVTARQVPPKELAQGRRHLTPQEIAVLRQNRNVSSDPDWQNVLVSAEDGCFDPSRVVSSEFCGWVVIGTLRDASLKFHDLELPCGIYRSYLSCVSLGDDCVVNNVSYLANYRVANRVMLFNVQEMSCTEHSKFGNGFLKDGESEDVRVWIGVGNENGERSVLAFEDMIAADAFLWSRYREDAALMRRFVELTELGNDRSRPTFGTVDDDAVIKNCTLIKDAKIGSHAYVKGAFKLKNMTVLSSAQEPSQIGEGVEMVNGIMGYGSRVFYQAVAVRFVIGRNCQLKYGARLLNSVLGDNSTVSCCELLNNLIFPFHEQHHNSSFLIAATLQGQTNIASAATIGSNHNSRSPDGEMIAGRGFWPGLCSDFKYDSRFASFVLVSKGSYKNELNITYPFCLVAPGEGDGAVRVIPAYWFLYNMFAIERNKFKFAARDRRVVKVQHIETDPLAPDTMQEVLDALERLIELTARYLLLDDDACRRMTETVPDKDVLARFRERAAKASAGQAHQVAKDFLHTAPEDMQFLLTDDRCQRKHGAVICKPLQSYRAYRRIAKYFAADCLINWCTDNGKESLSAGDIGGLLAQPLYDRWVNAGGQVIPQQKVDELFGRIKDGTVQSWQQVHAFYDECEARYVDYKARYALHVLETLYARPIAEFTPDMFADITRDVAYVSMEMLESSISSREKDYTDFFRTVTFRNKAEMQAVLGTLNDNSFLHELRGATDDFNTNLERLFKALMRTS